MSFILASVLRSRFHDRMLQVEREHPSARTTGKTSCQRSGLCCWQRPCELGPGDPERIAAHLGISTAELFREHLVVDRFDWGLCLLPRRGEQTGGQFLSDRETYDSDTPCVFLTADRTCQIHDVKPAGGRQFACWLPEAERKAMPRYPWTAEALMALGWDGCDDAD